MPVVATDDEKIAECCRGFGADVIMTSESSRNGRFFSFVVVRFHGFGQNSLHSLCNLQARNAAMKRFKSLGRNMM